MNPLLDTLGWLGSSLDKPGAAVRGLLAGRPDQLANLIPFGDTMGLTDPSQRTEGADLLGLDRDSAGGMLGGMAVNVATDPLNWLMGAGLARNLLRGRQMGQAYKTAQTGYEGEQAARQALMPAVEKAQANNALRQELLGTGGMPEEVARLTKAVDAEGNPVRTYHGTGQVYDRFDPAKDTGGNLFGPGYYSTESPVAASGYAGQPELILGTSETLLEPPEALAQELRARLARAGPIDRDQLEALNYSLESLLRPPSSASYSEDMHFWKETFPDAGINVDDLMGPGKYTSPHVRMQHLDVRNPLNLNGGIPQAEARALAAKLGRGPLVEDYLNTTAHDIPGENFYNALVMGNPSLYAQGNEKALLNQQLWEAGHDAIMHQGGLRSNNTAHQVYITHRPEQIYSPWVAPLQMAEPALPGAYPPARPVPPRVSPLIASLLGQNALGRTG